MGTHVLQATFSRGEITDVLHARVDLELFRSALKQCTNFWVMRHGGLRKRPGSVFMGYSKTNAHKVTLIPFTFSTEQSYMLAFENNVFRVYTSAGPVTSLGSPIEVATPYSAAEAAELQYAQSADVLYVAHKNHAPRAITRTSDTSWTVTTVSFEDGPFLKEPKGTRATITPSTTGAIHPKMTSNTTPSGVASAFEAFDWDKGNYFDFDTALSPDASYTPTASKVVDSYWIRVSKDTRFLPTAWEFQGYDGASWVTLHEVQGESAWLSTEVKFYSFVNSNSYSAYRIHFISSNDTGGNTRNWISELAFGESGDTMSPITFTFSSTNGVNNGAGFSAADVGRTIRIRGNDGKWRWVVITSVSSTTVIAGRMYGYPLANTDRIARWRLGAWSTASGWPARVSFFSERLAWARTNSQPYNYWTSSTLDFENHVVSEPLVDDDAVSGSILSGEVNEIQFLSEQEDLIIGTSGALRSLGVQDITNGFSAVNAKQKPHRRLEFAAIQPVNMDGNVIAVDYYRKMLRAIGPNDNGTGYSATDLSIMSEHLFTSEIGQLAFAPRPDSIIWSSLGNGSAVATTYERDQQVIGFGKTILQGGTIESVACKRGAGQTEVWFSVLRTINGVQKRYIERLAVIAHDHSELDAVYLDCSIAYSGVATTTFTGAQHLAGETVQVFADGARHPDVTVSLAGGFTLNYAASKVVIGKLFTATARTLRFGFQGQDGAMIGRKVRVNRVYADVLNTPHLRCGSQLEGGEVITRESGSIMGSPVPAQTGAFQIEIADSWQNGGEIIVESREPFAAIVRALNIEYTTEP